jgi:hypothetical protein
LDVPARWIAPEYLDFKRRYEGKGSVVRRKKNGLSVSEQPVSFLFPEWIREKSVASTEAVSVEA